MFPKQISKKEAKRTYFLLILTFTVGYGVLSYFLIFRRISTTDTSSTIGSGNVVSSFSGINRKDISQICHGTHCFNVEVAHTPAQLRKGLMGRTGLQDNEGMLFIFEQKGHHAFWMKNTLIPLDILRLDENFVVKEMTSMKPCTSDPCPSYRPIHEAQYVIELPQGSIQKHSIRTGTQRQPQ